MDRDDFIDAIETQGRRLADAADRAGLAAPVPSCPGWTVRDLVLHVSGILEFWQALLSGAVTDPSAFVRAAEPADADVVATFRADLAAIAATLRPLAPDTPCWTWSDQHDVGFVQRRLAQELAVHAWDATLAAGEPQPIEAALAVDGVDEYFDVFWPSQAGHVDGDPFTGHLHATDIAGEWFIRTGPGEWSVERTHAKGDVAVRGTAGDLVLLMWGRTPVDGGAFEVFGEPAAVADLLARVAMS